MANLIKKAYESFDNFMMYETNKAVHAWNWTTGRTKADLANTLLRGGGVFQAIGTLGFAGLYLPNFISETTTRNIEIEKKEIEACENAVMDSSVIEYKNKCKNVGYAFGALSGLVYSLKSLQFPKSRIPYEEELCQLALSSQVISILLWSASAQIMRTDYLPPQKNCISRAKDKLVERVQAYRTKPKLAPVQA